MLRVSAWLFLLISVTAVSSVWADESFTPVPAQRIAVMNLRVTGEGSEQVKEWLPALIEDNLLSKGWSLVVRGERMQHIQEERNLAGVDPDTKSEGNTLLGATAFLELTARIQTTGVQGALGFGKVTLGDYVRASVDLNGQIVDVKTGLLKSSVKVGGSAGGLKTLAIVALDRNWNLSGGGINLPGIRDSLLGKAADKAADRLVAKLDLLYSSPSTQKNNKSRSTAQTRIKADIDTQETILIDLPNPALARVGERYGVFRDNKLVAELEIIRILDRRAEAKIISQYSLIQSTDRARRMPMTIRGE